MRLGLGVLVWVVLLAALAPKSANADPTDGQFSESVWMTRIITERTSRPLLTIGGEEPSDSSATSMAWAPDGSGRLFVTMQDGTVGVVLRGGAPEDRLAVVFTTIDPIYTAGECGLLGLTFDPNFQRNHFVYFFVTVSDHEQQIIR